MNVLIEERFYRGRRVRFLSLSSGHCMVASEDWQEATGRKPTFLKALEYAHSGQTEEVEGVLWWWRSAAFELVLEDREAGQWLMEALRGIPVAPDGVVTAAMISNMYGCAQC